MAQRSTQSQHFTLLHGACLSSWHWHRVVTQMEADGYSCLAVDAPGRGDQARQATHTSAMQEYVASLEAQLDHLSEPTILVAHGASAIIASQFIEQYADRVTAVVYLAGFVLRNGDSIAKVSNGITTSWALNHMVYSDAGNDFEIERSKLRRSFCSDLSQQGAEEMARHMTTEPTELLHTPLAISDQYYGSVPAFYIECTQDNIIPIGIQRISRFSREFNDVYSVNASHMAMLSKPGEVCDILQDIARQLENPMQRAG